MKRITSMWMAGFAAVLMLVANDSFAVSMDSLYSAEVRVADSSEEERDEALGTAMRAVLVRVTGSQAQARHPALDGIVESASLYVQAYRYKRSGNAQTLAVRFDGDAVQQAVAGAGVGVWGAERPRTLVWLAIDYGGGRRTILQADSDGPVSRAIRSAAQERGLPVSLPLMDAQDREKISFADIWAGFSGQLSDASRRYAPDAILVGRARRRQGGRLGVEWKLYFGNELTTSEGSVGDGIQRTADFFARQFVVGGSDAAARDVRLAVTDVASLRQYARVVEHLGELSVVEDAQLAEVRDSTFIFVLRLRGSQQQLRRAIALANVIEEHAIGQDSGFPERELRYRPVP